MELKDIMQEQNFILCGDTLNEEKYAYKIKYALLEAGYDVFCVGKEHESVDEANLKGYILNLCIHPVKGLALLKNIKNLNDIKGVLIQPGAESIDIINFLKENNISYLEGCALVGLKIYKREGE